LSKGWGVLMVAKAAPSLLAALLLDFKTQPALLKKRLKHCHPANIMPTY